MSDSAGAKMVLDGLSGRFPRMRKVCTDYAYRGLEGWMRTMLGWDLEVMRHNWSGGVWMVRDQEPPSRPISLDGPLSTSASKTLRQSRQAYLHRYVKPTSILARFPIPHMKGGGSSKGSPLASASFIFLYQVIHSALKRSSPISIPCSIPCSSPRSNPRASPRFSNLRFRYWASTTISPLVLL